ncbi:PstS family phosphate ABC transporter substrate-binding protein [Exiguobacterium indicum]|uniref:PstS family phosphate ABC transporter substrate-binding protein n=1 Tax=Exiguobacterium TaxID=33986 RepID=UPI001BE862D8|nr:MULTISPECIES: PstS family phosphate ABC transporter substrate-binding protein [Exiguobacterium]
MSWMKKTALITTVASIAVVGAACGNDKGGSASSSDLKGKIAIDGSSTVFPIMEAVGEEYSMEQPDVDVTVGVSGTGGGFKRFVVGETDLSNASREIKEEEAAEAKKNNIEFTKMALAYDGLTVAVSKENTWVKELTMEQLEKIWLDPNIKTWKDVDSSYPAEPLKFFSPGKDSGTFDFFSEEVLEKKDMRKDVQLSEDDNVLVKGVEGTKGAIGYFGYAYYAENKDKLKEVPLAAEGKDAVDPTPETIKDLSYPLSREIYTYINNKSMKDKKQVADFVQFTNENAGDLAEEVGYIKMPQDRYDENAKAIEDAMK